MKMQSWVWVQHGGFAMFLLLLRFRHVLKIHALLKKRLVDKSILDAKVYIAAPTIIFLVKYYPHSSTISSFKKHVA
jgi:hypothetical protein